MTVRTIVHPDGRTFRLGRRAVRVRRPTLRLRNYLMRGLPNPPATVDYSSDAMTSLGRIMLNDKYGCCVIAWIGHAVGVFTGNASGNPAIMSDDEVVAAYGAIGGFDPKNPTSTDNGCDEDAALAYWQNTGITIGATTHKISGSLAVNPGDPEEVRVAIWLFENVMFGVGLPEAWLDPMPSGNGFTWGVAGDSVPDNGHCFGAMKYGASLLGIDTWGMLGSITDGATAKYASASVGGQLCTVISQDSIIRASGRAPSGFDFSQLMADFDSLR